MIGHDSILRNLHHWLGRGVLSHGYIFHGPSMVGKRMVAWEFARQIESPFSTSQILGDVQVIQPPDGGMTIGIDAIRTAKHFLWQKPAISRRRILIIDLAELLTVEAQNALLKVTEEPPESSLIFLVTADAERLLPTILSRLPKIYFAPVSGALMIDWLMREKKLAKAAAVALARKAQGRPGLAERLLQDEAFQKSISSIEQLLSSTGVSRRDHIKKIIAPEDFNFGSLLEILLMVLSWRGIQTSERRALWHKAAAVAAREHDIALNPRLQLEYILSESSLLR